MSDCKTNEIVDVRNSLRSKMIILFSKVRNNFLNFYTWAISILISIIDFMVWGT